MITDLRRLHTALAADEVVIKSDHNLVSITVGRELNVSGITLVQQSWFDADELMLVEGDCTDHIIKALQTFGRRPGEVPHG